MSSWHWDWGENVLKYNFTQKSSRFFFFRMDIFLQLGVPNNQISLHFGNPNNQILVRNGLKFGCQGHQNGVKFGCLGHCNGVKFGCRGHPNGVKFKSLKRLDLIFLDFFKSKNYYPTNPIAN